MSQETGHDFELLRDLLWYFWRMMMVELASYDNVRVNIDGLGHFQLDIKQVQKYCVDYKKTYVKYHPNSYRKRHIRTYKTRQLKRLKECEKILLKDFELKRAIKLAKRKKYVTEH